jgi:hypothetical protein
LNLRPLDPQNGGVSVSARKTRCRSFTSDSARGRSSNSRRTCGPHVVPNVEYTSLGAHPVRYGYPSHVVSGPRSGSSLPVGAVPRSDSGCRLPVPHVVASCPSGPVTTTTRGDDCRRHGNESGPGDSRRAGRCIRCRGRRIHRYFPASPPALLGRRCGTPAPARRRRRRVCREPPRRIGPIAQSK